MPFRDFRPVPSAYQPRAHISIHEKACTQALLLYIIFCLSGRFLRTTHLVGPLLGKHPRLTKLQIVGVSMMRGNFCSKDSPSLEEIRVKGKIQNPGFSVL